VGLPNFVVRISHRKLLSSLGSAAGVPDEAATMLYRGVDKLDKIGPEGVMRELVAAGLAEDVGRRVLELVTTTGEPRELLNELRPRLQAVPGAEAALNELDELFGYLPDFGVPADRYMLDLSLARGLDYYTGPVYEATVTQPKVGSVAGAGRYDGLVGAFLGRQVPATGISLGLERIIEVVHEYDLLPAASTVAQVAVIVFPETVGSAARIATELREAGLRVDLSLQPNRSVGDQLKQAGRRGVPLAVIVGAAELDAGRVAVKDLRSGEQTVHPLVELASVARARVGMAAD
jgi:histidyl-tRNA synthetase